MYLPIMSITEKDERMAVIAGPPVKDAPDY